jgi:pimeloyl-ACP methyl ester carboxylesterase
MEALPLPKGVRSAHVASVNGLSMHCLSAGRLGDPLLLLLHGFPELAFSWRNVLVPLAAAGYHVVAPDQRGYGRTVPADQKYHFAEGDDLVEFRSMNRVADMVALVCALGYERCDLVGHDFGSSFAFWCAMARPDMFRSLVMMSAPVAAQPPPHAAAPDMRRAGPVHDDLASLGREHYQRHYCLSSANAELMATDLASFFRAYYHMKSADWAPNQAHVSRDAPQQWNAAELCKLPKCAASVMLGTNTCMQHFQPLVDRSVAYRYYVMEKGKTMPETVAEHWGPESLQVGHERRQRMLLLYYVDSKLAPQRS